MLLKASDPLFEGMLEDYVYASGLQLDHIDLTEAWQTRGKKLSAAHKKAISDALKKKALLKGTQPDPTPKKVDKTGDEPTGTKKRAFDAKKGKLGDAIQTPDGPAKITKIHGKAWVQVEGAKKKWYKSSELEVDVASKKPLDKVIPDPTPAPKVKKLSDDLLFPNNTSGLTHKKALGGSTGAALVEDPDTGGLFVHKKGASKAHIEAEAGANSVYAAVGVKVPKHKLFEKEGVQLTEYLADAKPLAHVKGAELETARKQIGRHFVLDAVMGNRDVVGPDNMNVMVKDGVAYRIDNGASFDYRAQGGKKEYTASVGELASLRDPKINPTTAALYAHLSNDDIRAQALDLHSKRQSILDATPPQYKDIVNARIDDVLQKTGGLPGTVGAPIANPLGGTQAASKPVSTVAAMTKPAAPMDAPKGPSTKLPNGVSVQAGDVIASNPTFGVKYTVDKVNADGSVDVTSEYGGSYKKESISNFGHKHTTTPAAASADDPKGQPMPANKVKAITSTKDLKAIHPVGSSIILANGTEAKVIGHTTGYLALEGAGKKYHKLADLAAQGATYSSGAKPVPPAAPAAPAYTAATATPAKKPASFAGHDGTTHNVVDSTPGSATSHKTKDGSDINVGDVIKTGPGTPYKVLGESANGGLIIQHPSGKVYDQAPSYVKGYMTKDATASTASIAAAASPKPKTKLKNGMEAGEGDIVVTLLGSTYKIDKVHPDGSADITQLTYTGGTPANIVTKNLSAGILYGTVQSNTATASSSATYSKANPPKANDTVIHATNGTTYKVLSLEPNGEYAYATNLITDKDVQIKLTNLKPYAASGVTTGISGAISSTAQVTKPVVYSNGPVKLDKKLENPPVGLPHAYVPGSDGAPAAHVDPTPAHVKAALSVAQAPTKPDPYGGSAKYDVDAKPSVGQAVWYGAGGAPGVVKSHNATSATIEVEGGEVTASYSSLKPFNHATYSAPKVSSVADESPFTKVEGWPTKFVQGENTKHSPIWVKQQTDVVGSFTSAEKDSVTSYTGNTTYGKINNHLRFGDGASPTIKKHIDNIDAAMNKSRLENDIVVYRGIGANPKTGQPVEFKVGELFQDHGYMSTSVAKNSAFHGSTVMEILAPKGSRGVFAKATSVYQNEDEFLLGRGTKFMVHEIVQSGYQRLVRMEIISDE